MSALRQYIKRPIPILAFQWGGQWPHPAMVEMEERGMIQELARLEYRPDGILAVRTLEGTLTARPGDYVCIGDHGDVWPVKRHIFEETYEEVVHEEAV